MTTIILEPPAEFINANERLHYAPKAKRTSAWRQAACEAAPRLRPIVRPSPSGALPILAGFEPNTYERAHITVTIRFADNRRRDVGNLYPTAKAIVDGLVDARLLADDDDTRVVGPDMRREYPNGSPRVTVTIEGLTP